MRWKERKRALKSKTSVQTMTLSSATSISHPWNQCVISLKKSFRTNHTLKYWWTTQASVSASSVVCKTQLLIAGYCGKGRRTEEGLHYLMASNLFGPFLLTNLLLGETFCSFALSLKSYSLHRSFKVIQSKQNCLCEFHHLQSSEYWFEQHQHAAVWACNGAIWRQQISQHHDHPWTQPALAGNRSALFVWPFICVSISWLYIVKCFFNLVYLD